MNLCFLSAPSYLYVWLFLAYGLVWLCWMGFVVFCLCKSLSHVKYFFYVFYFGKKSIFRFTLFAHLQSFTSSFSDVLLVLSCLTMRYFSRSHLTCSALNFRQTILVADCLKARKPAKQLQIINFARKSRQNQPRIGLCCRLHNVIYAYIWAFMFDFWHKKYHNNCFVLFNGHHSWCNVIPPWKNKSKA